MDKKTMGNWIMYYEIQRLLRDGYSKAAISKTLGLNPRTVSRYASMTEAAYEAFLISKETRTRLLSPYEDFVKSKLQAHPSVSAAQMHDWLKEHYPAFPDTPPKTVYNFVMALRRKYDIPLESAVREYFVVAELPYGQQAQADFGHYTLRSTENRRKTVHFFVMMLSRSRMKFLRFSDIPFTTRMAIAAHEEAFQFFGGQAKVVVYDQDRLFLVEEAMGELLLTHEFRQYVLQQGFELHFCRKADPESKGKVENVVKYVKNNFLQSRLYYDLETLQSQALGWLKRTGNGMPHSTTNKVPAQEWLNEQPHLQPWVPISLLPAYILRAVRKDNTFSFQGNFYSVPQGTFKSKETMVMLWIKEGELHIHDQAGDFLCKHTLAETSGNTIINTDHKRDKSLKVKELLQQTAHQFANPALALQYFEMIRKEKARYLRDQVQAIQKAIAGKNRQLVAGVLEKCVKERHIGAVVFRELLAVQEAENNYPVASFGKVILLDPNSARKADIAPDRSDLNEYEKAFAGS
jgi:transposase